MSESCQRSFGRLVSVTASLWLVVAVAGCANGMDEPGPETPGGAGSMSLNGIMGVAGGGIGQPIGTGGTTGMSSPVGGNPSARPNAGMGAPAMAGSAGASGVSGASGSAGNGMAGAAGMAGGAGMAGAGGMAGSAMPPPMDTGDCCPDGNCLCHGPAPTALTSANGPFDVDSYELPTGTVYYPTDAEPPFAAVAIIPGLFNVGPEMGPWGPFYASHGIVLIAVHTGAGDLPPVRAVWLLDAIDELKAENTKSGSKLMGKLSGRYGTSGYSMGGGGTTIASGSRPELKTSVGLAAWAPDGTGVMVPTLLLCGEADGTAGCSMSSGAYRAIPESTPKMMFTIPGVGHLSWFGPTDAGRGTSGALALAFQKVFLEGDERWRALLVEGPSGGGTMTTNIE